MEISRFEKSEQRMPAKEFLYSWIQPFPFRLAEKILSMRFHSKFESIWLYALLISVWACGSSANEVRESHHAQEIQVLASYSTTLPTNVDRHSIHQAEMIALNGRPYFQYFNRADSVFYVTSIFDREGTRFELSHFFEERRLPRLEDIFVVPTLDSLIFISSYSSGFYVIQPGGQYSRTEIEENGLRYAYVNSAGSRIRVSDHKMIAAVGYENIDMDSTHNYSRYFSRNPIAVVDFKMGTSKLSGSFPPEYKTAEHPTVDFYAQPVWNTDDESIIYGFRYNDFVGAIHSDLADVQSKHYDLSAPKSSTKPALKVLGDFAEKRKYSERSPGYLNLVYDRYRKCYYRSFYMGVNEAGKRPGKPQPLEAMNWHILIYDPEFNFLASLDMSGSAYYPYDMIPLPEGVLLTRREENADNQRITIGHDLVAWW